MIRRLKKLELEDFRIFGGLVSVPLDADVVVIYGPNASGKTGLVSAIEYAVTGAVEDLQAFSDDYPRCLRNIRATGEPKACLYFESTTGESLYLSSPVGGRERQGSRSADMPGGDRRFFIEKCYLPQRRLARLFEVYQSCNKQEPEQPLVRFIRELLALDLLENLTTGLYEAGNILRLRKVCPSLNALKSEEESAPERRASLEQQREEQRKLLKASMDVVHAALSRIGDPVSDAPWTAAGLHARIEVLEAAEHGQKLSAAIQRLQQSQGKLESALGLLRASGSAITEEQAGLQARLVELGKSSIGPRLALLLQHAESVLSATNFSVPEAPPAGDVDRRLGDVEDAVRHGLARLETEIRVRNETELELAALEKRAAEMGGALQAFEPTAGQDVREQRRRAAALHGLLDQICDEICPVCGRDYSEVKAGKLRSHILQEIERVGLDCDRMESGERRRSQLETERDEVLRRAAAIRDRVRHDQSPMETLQTNRDLLLRLLNTLADEKESRLEWARLKQEEAGIRLELGALDERLSQQNRSTQQVSRLADELGFSKEERPPDVEALADQVSKHLHTQIDQLDLERRCHNELLLSLTRAEGTARELEVFDKKCIDLSAREREIRGALARVEQCIEGARGLARAANSAKERLLREVFNENLNGLWEDIFERLVKAEAFVPRLGEPTARRGQIRAAIRAIAKGVEPFEQAGSVLSAANLNTAALSLFLSLHLVEQPRHRVIVFDDPIQSMDDVHVTQLANMLRAIVRQADRQLVLCVHERSLYEYLCLELGPTRDSDSLLAIELIPNPTLGGSTIRDERRTWKPDLVEFGARA